MLLQLYARVRLYATEEAMEADQALHLDLSNSKEWVWRNMAIPVQTVKEVVSYNKVKTIVHSSNGRQILVAETFEDVYQKWQDALYEYYKNVGDFYESTEEEEEEEEDTEE